MNTKQVLNILKNRRQELRKTQTEIGRSLGVTKSSYGKKEMGISSFSIEELEKVCKVLGLDFEDLQSSLPMQSKSALITAEEYVALTNKMLELQSKTERLQEEKEALVDKIRILELHQQNNIFTFFRQQVEAMQKAYPEHYKINWIDVATAANIEQPAKFIERFGEYSAYFSSNFMDDTGIFAAANILDSGFSGATDTLGDVNHHPAPKKKSGK